MSNPWKFQILAVKKKIFIKGGHIQPRLLPFTRWTVPPLCNLSESLMLKQNLSKPHLRSTNILLTPFILTRHN